MIQPPIAISKDAIAIAEYAAFGGPRDSILAIHARMERNLEALIPPAQLSATRTALLTRPFSLALPILGPNALLELSGNTDLFTRAVASMAAGKNAKTRVLLDSLNSVHAQRAPGEVTMDATLQKAFLFAELGDTAAAESLLDRALNGIPRATPTAFTSVILIASLVRAMLFRAELAAKSREGLAAKTWLSAADALWRHGDAENRAMIERVRSLVVPRR